jgi:hypothetical protein
MTIKKQWIFVTVAVVTSVLIVWNRQVIKQMGRLCLYSSDKCDNLLLLDKIQVAEIGFKKELDSLEHQCNVKKQKQEDFDAITKKQLGMMSIDLDFALQKLDQVSGDEELKAMRKKMVEKFGLYVIRIDALLKQCVMDITSLD